MKYTSTRNNKLNISGTEAIVKGISVDGGLFVPKEFPLLSRNNFDWLCECDYPQRSAYIMSLFLDEFSYDEMLAITSKAYSSFDGDPCPLVNIDGSTNVLELWHGPTCAFKDMALTVLPYLLTESKRKLGIDEKTLVLVATSGDTGKAALEGFKDVPDVDILVFYPNTGVSALQKLQMQTQKGNNVGVYAINGNFDDAQTAVKTIFNDKNIVEALAKKGYALSSANSINWGRLLPQIAYYVSAYCDLLTSNQIAENEKFNVCVPTGNFGNILACIYAKKMGVPVGNIICASNENNILTDFFNTGIYDTKRKFHKTISPSMDILVSSNLERLLFEVFERDDTAVVELMNDLATKGKYQVDINLLLQKVPYVLAGYATEDEVKETISAANEEFDYVVDPHTAVAVSVYDDYDFETGDDTIPVIVSTASPFKFPCAVLNALEHINEKDEFKALRKLQNDTGLLIPEQIANLEESEIRFSKIIDKHDIKKVVFDYLGE